MSVSVNGPKTPVTKGSKSIAAATVPNVCKMPGPPAPFVPTPLPNIGKSDKSPDGYSKSVKFEGKEVAIKGATFRSVGDVASKGTGGGLVSSNTEGITKFVGPGSMDVKIEGKNVQLLSDPMLNNCGPSGNPPNAATMEGVVHECGMAALWGDEKCPLCDKVHEDAPKVDESDDTKNACAKFKKIATEAFEEALKKLKEKRKAESNANIAKKIKKINAQLEKYDPQKTPQKFIKRLEQQINELEKQKNEEPDVRNNHTGMIGTLQCLDCGHIHAGFSGEQFNDVQKKMPTDWHSPKAYTDFLNNNTCSSVPTVENFIPYVKGYEKKFRHLWQQCLTKNTDYNDPDKNEPKDSHNPPGLCAAQQLMLLALDHGCLPFALTEQWFNARDANDRFKGEVYYRTLDKDGKPSSKIITEPQVFSNDQAIPPCGTCRIIIGALMCPDQRSNTCSYKPNPEVCRCK